MNKTHCDICDKILGISSDKEYTWHRLFLSPVGKEGIEFDICNDCHDSVRDKLLEVIRGLKK